MSTAAQALTGYAQAATVAPVPRDTEYRVFADVTRHLADVRRDGADFARLADALYRNQRLWTRLAGDVAGDGNGLPPELRAQIISLAGFVREHSRKVLQNGATPDVLIEINTAIMRGLKIDATP